MLSMPTTLSPLSKSFLARWKPIKPAVPVMSIFIIYIVFVLPEALLFVLTQRVNRKVKAEKAFPRFLHVISFTQCKLLVVPPRQIRQS